DVFIAVLRIEGGGELRAFVCRDFFARASDVVTDLLAGPIVPAARQRKLVGSGAIPGGAGDFLAVFFERILESVGLHQPVDRPFAFADFSLEIVPQIADLLWLSFHQTLDHFLEENALELFKSTRFERTALDDDLAVTGEERVVLRLITEHRFELLIEFDLDAG